jgi:hypothetical protein
MQVIVTVSEDVRVPLRYLYNYVATVTDVINVEPFNYQFRHDLPPRLQQDRICLQHSPQLILKKPMM